MTVPSVEIGMLSEYRSSHSMTSRMLLFGKGISPASIIPHRRMSASSALACRCSSAWKYW